MTDKIISFLIDNKYIDNLPSRIIRMCQGTESKNYIIKNGNNKIVYKIMNNPERLQNIIIHSNLLQQAPYIAKILSPVFTFQGKKGVLMEYKSGKILKPSYLTEPVCQDLVRLYFRFSNNINRGEHPRSVMPENDLIALKEKALSQLAQKQSLWARPFAKFFSKWLSSIPNDQIRHQPQKTRIIHGDFKPRNVLLDKENTLAILDLEGFMYGHPAEDWGRFIMRSIERLMDPWRVKQFKNKQVRIFKEALPYTQAEWELGYYNFLIQKLEKKSREPLSLYQSLNLWVIIHYATELMDKK